MAKVFISYSRQDAEFADKLTKSLEDKGVSVWVDRSDIKGGADWRREISEAIRNCRAFLLILSSRSTGSQNVDDELYLAKDRGRPIFPILYETCELPPGVDLVLSRQQRISFAGIPFERALQQVLDALPPSEDAGAAAAPKPAIKPEPASPPQGPRAGFDAGRQDFGGGNPAGQNAGSYGYFPSPMDAPQQPPQPPPLNQIVCGRWNIVAPIFRANLEFFPNGSLCGQLFSGFGTSNVNSNWQITPNGMLSCLGQMVTGWAVTPFMLNVNFNQVTAAFMTGICLDGTQLAWYRLN